MSRRGGSQLARRRRRDGWLFLAPILLVLGFVAAWPLVRTMSLSLTDATLAADREADFVGLDNYLGYGPPPGDWDPQVRAYFVFYEPEGAALMYRPGTGRFYDLARESPADAAADASGPYEEDGRLVVPPAEPGGAAVAYGEYPGAVDRAAVFGWHGLFADPLWWRSVVNTLVFAVGSVGLELVLGMAIALILDAHLPGRGLLRAAMLIPWAIPTIVSAQLWGWMLHDQVGVVNEVLLGLGLIGERLAWTADPALSLPAVIAVDVWKTTPFMALLILAALQMLPHELYEAGRIDGVHPARMFLRVTLPLIWPAVLVAVIFRMLDALRVFDLIYVLTPGSEATMSMSIYARERMLQFQEIGLGSAAATAVFAVVAAITALVLVAGRARAAAGR